MTASGQADQQGRGIDGVLKEARRVPDPPSLEEGGEGPVFPGAEPAFQGLPGLGPRGLGGRPEALAAEADELLEGGELRV